MSKMILLFVFFFCVVELEIRWDELLEVDEEIFLYMYEAVYEV